MRHSMLKKFSIALCCILLFFSFAAVVQAEERRVENQTNAPLVYQPAGTGLCWAASSASILYATTGRLFLPREYCRTIEAYYGISIGDNGGRNAAEVAGDFRTVWGLSQARYAASTFDRGTIQMQIDANMPIFAALTSSADSEKGHAVVIAGYNFSGTYEGLIIMDPSLGWEKPLLSDFKRGWGYQGEYYWATTVHNIKR